MQNKPIVDIVTLPQPISFTLTPGMLSTFSSQTYCLPASKAPYRRLNYSTVLCSVPPNFGITHQPTDCPHVSIDNHCFSSSPVSLFFCPKACHMVLSANPQIGSMVYVIALFPVYYCLPNFCYASYMHHDCLFTCITTASFPSPKGG